MSTEHDIIHQELEGNGPAHAEHAPNDDANLKTPADRSPKAHMEQPPRDIEPQHEVQGHGRGPAGQFTDKGAPGLQKY